MKKELELVEKTVFNLEINEEIRIAGYRITRVPGGWIYCREECVVNIANPVFVPFSDK